MAFLTDSTRGASTRGSDGRGWGRGGARGPRPAGGAPRGSGGGAGAGTGGWGGGTGRGGGGAPTRSRPRPRPARPAGRPAAGRAPGGPAPRPRAGATPLEMSRGAGGGAGGGAWDAYLRPLVSDTFMSVRGFLILFVLEAAGASSKDVSSTGDSGNPSRIPSSDPARSARSSSKSESPPRLSRALETRSVTDTLGREGEGAGEGCDMPHGTRPGAQSQSSSPAMRGGLGTGCQSASEL